MLEVRAFGGVRADLNGRPLDLGGPRQRAVLGVLAAAGRRTVSADRFLEELWSGEPPPSAAGALQAYVSRLRAALEPDRVKRRPATVLVSAPPGYALSLPDEAVDTWHFAALVRSAPGRPDAEVVDRLDRALGLWTDVPFAEFVGQEWAEIEAARLVDLRAEAAEMRAAAALRLGGRAAVVLDLEEHVRSHPLREQAVALLARALYQGGRQAEALAALADLRTRLVEELGVDPSEEVRRLEADILRQADHLRAPVVAAPVAAAPVVADRSSSVPDAELVGREDELTRLGVAADALSGRPGLVWVEGDAGFGKSALVAHFCDRSVGRWSLARGHCSEVPGAPPGLAWHEVLRALGEETDATGPADPLPPYLLAERVRRALEQRGTPTIVALEDVHRADDDTLQVLRQVVETARATLLVVATFRSHEIGRELAATLALTTEHTLDRVRVGGLAPAEARTLLERQVGTGVPRPAGDLLVERSAGNPLFLRQLGRLVESEGIDVAVETVPTAIRDLLGRRIDRLPGATSETLAHAAVLGRDIDLDLLLALETEWGQGAEEDTVADHLDAGLVAGLVDAPRPSELRFTHALIRDTFYQRLAPLRRHRLHRAALTVLERDLPHRVDEIAHHAAASLDRRSAADAVPRLLAAADRARGQGAVAHLRAALRALDLIGAPWREEYDVRLRLVRALAVGGDPSAARAERERVIELAERHGSRADVARAWQWQAPLMWSRRSAETTDLPLVDRLRALADDVTDPAVRVELLAALTLEADPWDVPTVVAASAEAVAVAEQVGDPELLCRALNARMFSALAAPGPALLGEVGARLLDVAHGAGLHGYAAVAHVLLQSDAVGRADLPLAGEHVEEAVREGTVGQLPELLGLTAIFDATSRLLQDDLAGARSAFVEVCRAIAEAGDPNAANIELWALFAVDFVAGDCSGLHDQALAMTRSMAWHDNDLWVCTLLDAGVVERAREVWTAAPIARDATWLFNAGVRAHIACELEDLEQARLIRADLRPWSGRLTHTLNGALSVGPVDHYLARLESLLGDEAAARRHALVAERLTGPGQATAFGPGWVRGLC